MWFGTESGLAENFAFYIDKMEDQKWLPGENRWHDFPLAQSVFVQCSVRIDTVDFVAY
jgi:hypothetical protein